LIACALVVAGPATGLAAAASCQAPPGTAALDQYCEVVPSAEGPGRGSSGGQTSTLSPSTSRAIASLPAAQARELRQVLSRLDTTPGGPAADKSAGVSATNSKRPAAPPSNPLNAVTKAVGHGPTSGHVFPWFLVALWGILAAGSWTRYRRRHNG
jgi:hypothetical protein